MLKKLFILIIIPFLLFGSGLTNFAGTVEAEENIVNFYRSYYKTIEPVNLYFKFKPALNIIRSTDYFSTPNMTQSFTILTGSDSRVLVYGRTILSFLGAGLASQLSFEHRLGFVFKGFLLTNLTYRSVNNIEDYGINLGVIKYFKLFSENYFSISSDYLYEDNDEDLFDHRYAKLNYEYGMNFEKVSIIYQGYYTINHIMDLEESCYRNYFIFKIKLPKPAKNDKKWSIDFFIGNSIDIDSNRESEYYKKKVMHYLTGCSITI